MSDLGHQQIDLTELIDRASDCADVSGRGCAGGIERGTIDLGRIVQGGVVPARGAAGGAVSQARGALDRDSSVFGLLSDGALDRGVASSGVVSIESSCQGPTRSIEPSVSFQQELLV